MEMLMVIATFFVRGIHAPLYVLEDGTVMEPKYAPGAEVASWEISAIYTANVWPGVSAGGEAGHNIMIMKDGKVIRKLSVSN